MAEDTRLGGLITLTLGSPAKVEVRPPDDVSDYWRVAFPCGVFGTAGTVTIFGTADQFRRVTNIIDTALDDRSLYSDPSAHDDRWDDPI